MKLKFFLMKPFIVSCIANIMVTGDLVRTQSIGSHAIDQLFWSVLVQHQKGLAPTWIS